MSGVNAIETHELRKVYGGRAVVQGLSLNVGPGEVFGFLGPNGAGKSTTVKMLLGLVRPTGGQLRVLGGSVQDPEVRRQLGFLPEQFRFQTWMTGTEFLTFHGRLSGLKPSELKTRIPEVLALVGLAGRGGDTLGGYSKGMLQRVGLAQAILHRPRLVFLDEPTSALDPIGRVEVRDIILGLKQQGVSVFLNSHLLSEVEQVSDRVAFVNGGRVLRAGSMDELLGGAFDVSLRVDRLEDGLLATLRALPGLEVRGHDGTSATVRIPTETLLPTIADAVSASGARLYGLSPHRPDLESLFLELVTGRGEAARA